MPATPEIPDLDEVSEGGLDRTCRWTFPFAPGAGLRLATYSGSVRLVPWDREESDPSAQTGQTRQIDIAARIEAPAGLPAEQARRLVEAVRIEIERLPEQLSVRTGFGARPSPDHNRGDGAILPRVHYEIHAPRTLRLEIVDHRSAIRLEGFAGRLEIATHEGSVETGGSSGSLRIETHQGSARITGHRGSFEVATHRGIVELEGVRIEGASRVRTHRGQVAVVLAGEPGLNLSTDLGRRATVRGWVDERPLDWRGRSVETSLAGGGPELHLECHSGEILLAQTARPQPPRASPPA